MDLEYFHPKLLSMWDASKHLRASSQLSGENDADAGAIKQSFLGPRGMLGPHRTQKGLLGVCAAGLRGVGGGQETHTGLFLLVSIRDYRYRILLTLWPLAGGGRNAKAPWKPPKSNQRLLKAPSQS